MLYKDLVIIGGGPAGLAAGIRANEEGITDILIIERESSLGGILNQCIHSGFGLHTFKEELTGPEYADRFTSQIKDLSIPYKLNTMAIEITPEKVITAVNDTDGILEIKAKAIILAMGCRERPRGAINIPGSRCAGILTAGTAQKFVNIHGYLPGKEVVILGSGDIGLIMARRMTIEGAKVKAVVELMPYSGGLKRNIVQCLEDFNIPLLLSHTIIDIKGKDRIEGVTIAKVDKNLKSIPGTEEFILCDCLLLSVGLIPENDLSRSAGINLSDATGGAKVNESFQTNIEGIFACGNVLQVHDLVDFVTNESYKAASKASKYIQGAHFNNSSATLMAADGVKYTIPNFVDPNNIDKEIQVTFRVSQEYRDSYISVYFDATREIYRRFKIYTPGVLQSIVLPKKLFNTHPGLKTIVFKVEEEK
ncbi:MAG TPA: FAD-dependent oxidoreductase [Clostridiaceae bacterium]